MGGEWIQWAGGECPVALNVSVQVKFRDGMLSSPGMTAGFWRGNGNAETSCWLHNPDGPDSDIIAYRVVRP